MKFEAVRGMKFDTKKAAQNFVKELKKDKEKYNTISMSTGRNAWGWWTVSYFEWVEE